VVPVDIFLKVLRNTRGSVEEHHIFVEGRMYLVGRDTQLRTGRGS
jgi:hypothetical protein